MWPHSEETAPTPAPTAPSPPSPADKVLSIGENIQIRRFVRYAEGVNVPYIHMGGKVGVLVNLAVEGIADMAKVVEVGKDVAMQICRS